MKPNVGKSEINFAFEHKKGLDSVPTTKSKNGAACFVNKKGSERTLNHI